MWWFIICVVFYVVFDELQQHAEKSAFKLNLVPKGRANLWNDKIRPWLNVGTGWRNKHEWKPSWLFKTMLVFTTDGEHFFQWLKHIMLALSVVAFFPFWWAFIVWVFIGATSYLMNEVFLR